MLAALPLFNLNDAIQPVVAAAAAPVPAMGAVYSPTPTLASATATEVTSTTTGVAVGTPTPAAAAAPAMPPPPPPPPGPRLSGFSEFNRQCAEQGVRVSTISCVGPPDVRSSTVGAKKVTNSFFRTVMPPTVSAASKITERRAQVQTGYATPSMVREVARTTRNATLRVVTKCQLANSASLHGINVDPSEGGQIYAFEPASHEWFNVTLEEAIRRALPKWQTLKQQPHASVETAVQSMTLLDMLLLYCSERSTELRSRFDELFTYAPEPVQPQTAAAANDALSMANGGDGGTANGNNHHGGKGKRPAAATADGSLPSPPAKKRKKNKKPAPAAATGSSILPANSQSTNNNNAMADGDDALPDITEVDDCDDDGF